VGGTTSGGPQSDTLAPSPEDIPLFMCEKLISCYYYLFSNICDISFEVFTAVKIQVEVFWVVTPCSVVGYQRL